MTRTWFLLRLRVLFLQSNFKLIEKVVKSGMFYPMFITGLSGNGKTLMVEQVCAKLNKELIRVNITIETDEDDLLGGFRLVNGETKFMPGPVIEAMERGCTLLLDECDLGSNKLLCLQLSLKVKVFTSRRSTSGSLRKMGSTSLPLPTLRVRVLMMDGLSEPTFSTKRSLSGSRSRWNSSMPLRRLRRRLFSVL